MLKLYGQKLRCVWCGKSDKEHCKEIVMSIKQMKPPQEKAFVCSEECERRVLDVCKFIEKGMAKFLIGLILGTVMAVLGILTPLFGNKILIFSTLGLFILGITFIVFPFVTLQTVKIFGLKKGMILGQISGIILLLVGFILIFIIIISNSPNYESSKRHNNNYAINQQELCKDLWDTYYPQHTPEETLKLERQLMHQGIYCYDLPLFDESWRKRGSTIIKDERYKNTEEKFDKPFKVYKKEKYAILYYPNDISLGPEFLYRVKNGWVLDRTAVWDNIHYNYTNTGWFAYEGEYPYLEILQTIYNMQRIELDNGILAYQIKN
ncbi:hypothetical protein ACFL23_03605 [Patescibacteria group bacterium]